MTRKADPIHKVELANGKSRYRFVVDVGTRPDGRRDQRTYTYDTLKEAKAERAKILAARSTGTYVAPTKVTVAEVVDAWLAGRRNLRPGTRRTYADALQHAKDHLGHMQVQKVTKGHVDAMVTRLLAEGRKVNNRTRKTLSARTVNVVLDKLAAVFEAEVRQGHLGRNVVRLAERPAQTRTEMKTWTADQAAAFLAYTATDRLSAAWMLGLYGLRRGEILGLRWSDVSLTKGTITVRWARTLVAGDMVEGEPKTERGKRTLPLDPGLVDALTALQLRQREDAEAAGEAYQPDCPLCEGHHVIADQLGQPMHPQVFSDRFEHLVRAATLPAIRFHDTRHTCGTLMHLRGVKTAVISAWLGHASASFTMATYVHSQDDALTEAAATLGGAYQRAPEAASVDLSGQ